MIRSPQVDLTDTEDAILAAVLAVSKREAEALEQTEQKELADDTLAEQIYLLAEFARLKREQEVAAPKAVTIHFQPQQTAVSQQKQPEVVEEEIKCKFDVIPLIDRETFSTALSPDRKGLAFMGHEFENGLTIDAIQNFLTHNPHVTCLNLGEYSVTDAEFAALTSIPSLKSLLFPICAQITDAGLKALNGNKTLESLTLSRCGQMTAAGLEDIAAIQGLRSLELDRCADAIDLSILAKTLRLQFLKLQCDSIQVASFPALESLELRDVRLTDVDLEALQNNNPKLKDLTLKKCTGISDAAKALVLQKMQARELDSKAVLTFLMAMKKATKDKDQATKDKEAHKKPKAANPLYDPSKPAFEDMLLGDPLYDSALLKEIVETTLPPRLKTSFKDTFQ